jgi:hypothetical protein
MSGGAEFAKTDSQKICKSVLFDSFCLIIVARKISASAEASAKYFHVAC